MKVSLRELARVVHEARSAVVKPKKGEVAVPFQELSDDAREDVYAEVRLALLGEETNPLTAAIVGALK